MGSQEDADVIQRMFRVKVLRNHTLFNLKQYKAVAKVFEVIVKTEEETKIKTAKKKPKKLSVKSFKVDKKNIEKSQKLIYQEFIAELKRKGVDITKMKPEQSNSVYKLLLSDLDHQQTSKDYSDMSATYRNILEPKRFL